MVTGWFRAVTCRTPVYRMSYVLMIRTLPTEECPLQTSCLNMGAGVTGLRWWCYQCLGNKRHTYVHVIACSRLQSSFSGRASLESLDWPEAFYVDQSSAASASWGRAGIRGVSHHALPGLGSSFQSSVHRWSSTFDFTAEKILCRSDKIRAGVYKQRKVCGTSECQLLKWALSLP